MNYNDIDKHLCIYHETFMRGDIFRMRYPDSRTAEVQTLPAQCLVIDYKKSGWRIFDEYELNEALMESPFLFAATYRQKTRYGSSYDSYKAWSFQQACRQPGYLNVKQFQPLDEAIPWRGAAKL
ncbi:hypothetical protein BGX30_004610 [Mortierella sp. GBA39]|nr:hypothetical protein BGX30_004610 [Mortierella sp. GBA39]